MKKLLSLVIIVSTMFLCSCNNDGVNHPIVGHTYATSDGAITWYFASNGTAKTGVLNNGSMTYISNYTYTIKKNLVEVYCDNSNIWEDYAKGQLFIAFTYNAKNNTLTSDDWGVFYLKM